MLLDLGGRRLDGLVLEPDGEALEPLDGGRRGGLDDDLARDVELGAGRAVEIARRDLDLGRLAGAQGRRLRRKRHLEPLRDVVLDEEARLAGGRALRVGVGADAPGAVHGAGEERQREGPSAETLVLDLGAAVLDAVGALRDERQRQA